MNVGTSNKLSSTKLSYLHSRFFSQCFITDLFLCAKGLFSLFKLLLNPLYGIDDPFMN